MDPNARGTSHAPNTHGRAPVVQSMLTNTPVSSRNIVDLQMPAFLVGTSMVLDTTTPPLLSARVVLLYLSRQLAPVDRFSLMVSANAPSDSALSVHNAKPL